MLDTLALNLNQLHTNTS